MLLCVLCRCAQSGLTPLHYAVWLGHLDVARLLLERGADKEANDSGGTNNVRAHAPLAAAFRCAGARRCCANASAAVLLALRDAACVRAPSPFVATDLRTGASATARGC